MSADSFLSLLRARFPEISANEGQRIAKYRSLLLAENQIQNLTRLTEPAAFIEGHLEDVLALEKSGFLGEINLDMGSGGGVPGLLSAVLKPKFWVLTDSERRKADFLMRAVRDLEMERWVRVYPERAEKVLLGVRVDTVVARAVGPAERVLGWIGKCSTWNTLILFKGPSWKEEWKTFTRTGQGKKYEISREYSYEVGKNPAKSRVLVELRRVPRGTRG